MVRSSGMRRRDVARAASRQMQNEVASTSAGRVSELEVASTSSGRGAVSEVGSNAVSEVAPTSSGRVAVCEVASTSANNSVQPCEAAVCEVASTSSCKVATCEVASTSASRVPKCGVDSTPGRASNHYIGSEDERASSSQSSSSRHPGGPLGADCAIMYVGTAAMLAGITRQLGIFPWLPDPTGAAAGPAISSTSVGSQTLPFTTSSTCTVSSTSSGRAYSAWGYVVDRLLRVHNRLSHATCVNGCGILVRDEVAVDNPCDTCHGSCAPSWLSCGRCEFGMCRECYMHIAGYLSDSSGSSSVR